MHNAKGSGEGLSGAFIPRVPDAEETTMASRSKKLVHIATLLALTVWGLLSAMQGAALGMFAPGTDQYQDVFFNLLVYGSVLVSVLIYLFSGTLASVVMWGATFVALTIVFGSHGIGHASGDVRLSVWAIALRPGLSALVMSLLLPSGGIFSLVFSKEENAGSPQRVSRW
jgi:hypothetical protein